MHYRIKGHIIKSENAAKPVAQQSQYLAQWLYDNMATGAAADFGCGKLRYALVLSSRARAVTFVDSPVQLERRQIVHGVATSVRDYVREHLPTCSVQSVTQFEECRRRYDFILCSNVLSSIPCPRTRAGVMRLIATKLSYGGEALFVTQFRNSYFRDLSGSADVVPASDGWVLASKRGSFYYGIIDQGMLESRMRRAGFGVVASWVHKESAYVLGRRDGV